jgi:subtilase family protein
MRYLSRFPVYILAIAFASCVPAVVVASPNSVRLVVDKKLTFSPDPAAALYYALDETSIKAAGFGKIADYSSFVLYEGLFSAADALIQDLTSRGYAAREAPELDSINLLRHRLDADTGLATPSYSAEVYARSGSSGLYLVALRGFPLTAWLGELSERGVNVVEPLPPSAYLVHGPRTVVEGLKSLGFVRGVFAFTPAMKREPLAGLPPDAAPYQQVVVEAFEPTASDTLEPFLRSVAAPGSLKVTSRTGPRVFYAASMTDLDLLTLSHLESTYAITPVRPVIPSSERQAMLVANPTVGTNGRLTLPTTCANYGLWLNTRPSQIPDFSNTRVALVDTGFDDAQSGLHPDFTFNTQPTVIRGYGITIFNQTLDVNEDNITHGTVAASVVTGWAPFDGAATADDAEKYRYAHGLAPTVATAMDKYFSHTNSYSTENSNPYTRLNNALIALAVWSPNVINHSWNSLGYCGYENYSQLLDQHTRTAGVLHVVSAGNTNETTCGFVRAPATAKNALAVGATENYTLSSWVNNFGYVQDANPVNDYVGTCAWNGLPGTQDARDMPSFSARQRAGSVLKPELVAPGVRVTGPVSRDGTWEDCTGGTEPPDQDGTCNGIFCNKNIATLNGVRYGFSAGTSFAAPAVAGAAAVARKWFANISGNPAANPSPAMTKAILINGARDIGPHGMSDPGGKVRNENFGVFANITNIPSEYQGWGMLNLNRLLDSGSNHYWLDQTNVFTATGQTWFVNPYVVDGSKETRLTIVWTDRYSSSIGGTGGETYTAVNNLNAMACFFGGFACWHGNHWTGSGTTIQSSPSFSWNEAINNVEEIVIPVGAFYSGQQIYLSVNAKNLMGDMDPTCNPPGCTTTRQDFAVFGSNIRP